MRKIEFAMIAAVAISLAVKSYSLPGSAILLTVTTMALALFYAYLSTAYFNNISARKIFNKAALDKVSRKHKVLATYSGLAIALSIISILFQGNHWPAANMLTAFSVVVLMPA